MAEGARLFDLDGTLWDSFAYYAAIAAESGSITEEAARTALMAGENVMRLMDRLGLPRSRLSSALGRSAAIVVPHGGIDVFLDELRARGHPLAVVTSLAGSLALPVLEQLGLAGRFAVVIHAGSGAGGKPKPGPILAALSRLGVSASPSDVYIGDHVGDELAARSAGIRFAWAGWGYGTPTPGALVLGHSADILDL